MITIYQSNHRNYLAITKYFLKIFAGERPLDGMLQLRVADLKFRRGEGPFNTIDGNLPKKHYVELPGSWRLQTT